MVIPKAPVVGGPNDGWLGLDDGRPDGSRINHINEDSFDSFGYPTRGYHEYMLTTLDGIRTLLYMGFASLWQLRAGG